VGYNQDGRIELFALGDNDAVWHIGQTAPGDGWGRWMSLGQPAAGLLDEDPAVTQQQKGRLVVFAAAADGAIWLNMSGSVVDLPLVRR
jgi:hypothetical protein